MSNHMRYRIVILTLIAGIACLSVGPIPASLGQGPDGTAPMNVGAIAGGQRLTFVLYATDNKWQSFRVAHLSSTPLPAFLKWTFYSCEVTNL